MPDRLRARLVADHGAAAADSQFFRSISYLRVEGVTHSLVVDDGRVCLPVVVREISEGGRDGISPYGYSGGSLKGFPPDVAAVDFSEIGLVSLFLRDRVDGPTFGGGTPRAPIFIHDPQLPRSVRSRVMSKVRSNERRGYSLLRIPGSQADDDTIRAFSSAYEQTMRRASAAERYFFDLDYLRGCLMADSCWLIAVIGPRGDLASAATAVISDGILHYHLGGTADSYRADSPAKNVMVALMDLAENLSVPLNFGGGMAPGDSLAAFKAGFANTRRMFVTHEIVCDPPAYEKLSRSAPNVGFFPAYRAPIAAVGH